MPPLDDVLGAPADPLDALVNAAFGGNGSESRPITPAPGKPQLSNDPEFLAAVDRVFGAQSVPDFVPPWLATEPHPDPAVQRGLIGRRGMLDEWMREREEEANKRRFIEQTARGEQEAKAFPDYVAPPDTSGTGPLEIGPRPAVTIGPRGATAGEAAVEAGVGPIRRGVFEFRAGRAKQAIVRRELAHRKKHGLYPENQQLESAALAQTILDELDFGLPMYDPKAMEKQAEFYHLRYRADPANVPPALSKGAKTAQFGVGLGAFLAELTLLKRLPGMAAGGRGFARQAMAGRTGLAAEAQMVRLGRGVTETMAAATIGAVQGQDPVEAAINFVPLAGMGGLRTATARATTMGAYFGGGAALRGEDMFTILLEGVAGPLLFAIPDMARHPFRPKGARFEERGELRERVEQPGSTAAKLIDRWFKMQEEIGEGAGREAAPSKTVLNEMAATADAISKLHRSGKATGTDAALLREFVKHYRPETVHERSQADELQPPSGQTEKGDGPTKAAGVQSAVVEAAFGTKEKTHAVRKATQEEQAEGQRQRETEGQAEIEAQGSETRRGRVLERAGGVLPSTGSAAAGAQPAADLPTPDVVPPVAEGTIPPEISQIQSQGNVPYPLFSDPNRDVSQESVDVTGSGRRTVERAGEATRDAGGHRPVRGAGQSLPTAQGHAAGEVGREVDRGRPPGGEALQHPERLDLEKQVQTLAQLVNPAGPRTGADEIAQYRLDAAKRALRRWDEEHAVMLENVEAPLTTEQRTAYEQMSREEYAELYDVPSEADFERHELEHRLGMKDRLGRLTRQRRMIDVEAEPSEELDAELKQSITADPAVIEKGSKLEQEVPRSREAAIPTGSQEITAFQGSRVPKSVRGGVVEFGDVVDGRTVIGEQDYEAGPGAPADHIPNQGSISSSIPNFYSPPTIFSIPMDAFEDFGPGHPVRANATARVKKLADEIEERGEIVPLIAAVDKVGLYILEGGHRFDALNRSNAEAFPALVVVDLDDFPDGAEDFDQILSDFTKPWAEQPPRAKTGGILEGEPDEQIQQTQPTTADEGPVSHGPPQGAPAARRPGGRAAEPEPRPSGEGALAKVPTEPVSGVGRAGAAQPDVAEGGARPRPDDAGDAGRRVHPGPGGGVREPDVPVPAERGGVGRAPGEQRPTGRRRGDPGEGEQLLGGRRVSERPGGGEEPTRVTHTDEDAGLRDYVITPDDALFTKGPKTSARANVEAIRIAKSLEAEDRLATPDEQRALVQYTGWGNLAKSFNPYGDWKDIYQALTGVMDHGSDEWLAALASTVNAMYTPPDVIRAMYDAVTRLGFTGGAVLEPAIGSGHFFGLMPAEMRNLTRRVGLDMDHLSALIASKLYPKSKVFQSPYQKAPLPEGYFDLVISNVPFGDVKIFDKRYPRHLTRSVHDYYFVRTMDMVRPGGLVAFITSHFTMDKQDPAIREYIAERADLIGAIRLNKKSLPGTEVITDVMFLRRRAEGEKLGGQAWFDTRPPKGITGYVNEYYHDHPEMLIGTHSMSGTQYGGNEYSVDPPAGGLALAPQLAKAVARLPENVLTSQPRAEASSPPPIELLKAPKDVPEGSYYTDDAGLLLQHGGEKPSLDPRPKWLAEGSKGSVEARYMAVKQLVRLRDAARALLSAQRRGDRDEYTSAQKELGALYDRYAGPINKRGRLNVLGTDLYTRGIVAALEIPDGKGGWKRAAIFTQEMIDVNRPITKADNVSDALAASYANRGRLDVDYIAELTGSTPAKAARELIGNGLAFESPSGAIIPQDEYLSGNVRQKLADAQAAMAIEPDKYAGNVEALRMVVPDDIKPTDMDVSPGASWIPPEVMQGFAQELFGERGVNVHRIGALGAWRVSSTPDARSSVAARTKWGTNRKHGPELLEAVLNLKSIVVKDNLGTSEKPDMVVNEDDTIAAQQKAQAITDKFSSWIWQDVPRTTRLSKIYNDELNAVAPRRFDGSYMTRKDTAGQTVHRIPGLSQTWQPWKHQLDTIAGNLLGGNRMDNITIGGGKTLTLTVTARELMRLGIANKPVIVVDNATSQDFPDKARGYYPGHEFIALTSDDLSPKNRRATLSRMAFSRDAVLIMPQQVFAMIPMSADSIKRYFDGRIAEMVHAKEEAAQVDGKNAPNVKELEKAVLNLEATLERKLAESKKDEGLTFEDVGIDFILYDESQALKNLQYITRGLRQIKGLGPAEGNQRTFDFHMKAEFVQGMQNGRGVILSTGTPVSNSLVEVYTIQRYLAPQELERQGINSFDDWVRSYGAVETDIEASWQSGQYKEVKRLRRIRNGKAFSQFWASFTSMADDAEVLASMKKSAERTGERVLMPEAEPGPEGRYTVIVSDDYPELAEYRASLEARAKIISERSDKRPKKGQDIVLNIINDARLAAMDLRLVVPGFAGNPQDKMHKAADQIHRQWEADKEVKLESLDDPTSKLASPVGLTQIVFGNIGVWKPGELYSALGRLKELLLEKGIPESQIAIINEVEAGKSGKGVGLVRQGAFDRVNSGEVRVLMGSLKKLGVGVNVQRLLHVMHQLDPPWTPDLLGQGEGRPLRPGNLNPKVKLIRYVQKGGQDEHMYGLVYEKYQAIKSILAGKEDAGQFEDVDPNAEMFQLIRGKASLSPVVLKWTRAAGKLRRMKSRKRSYDNEQLDLRMRGFILSKQRARAEIDKSSVGRKVKAAAAEKAAGRWATIAGKKYEVPNEIGQAIVARVSQIPVGEVNPVEIGQLAGGTPIEARRSLGADVLRVFDTEIQITIEKGMDKKMFANVSKRMFDTLGGPAIERGILDNTIEHATSELAQIEPQLGKPFPHETELAELFTTERTLAAEMKALGQEDKPGDQDQPPPPKPKGGPGEDWDSFRKEGYLDAQMLKHVPGPMRADILKWLRERDPNLPSFGLGAAYNVPDPRNAWKRMWDHFSQKLQNMPAGQGKKLADALGRGLYGTEVWGQMPGVARALQQFHGAKNLSRADLEAVSTKVVERMEAIKRRFGQAGPQNLNKMLIDVAEENKLPSEMDAETRAVYEAAGTVVEAITDEFEARPDLHQYVEGFGLTNIIQLIKDKRRSPGLYLRMIYRQKIDPATNEVARSYRPKNLTELRRRMKGIQGGMFKHRRTNDMWGVHNYDGTWTSFSDADAAFEHFVGQRNDKALQKKYGESLNERVRIVDPMGVEMMEDLEPETDFLIRLARTVVDWRHNLETLKLYDYIARTVAHQRGEGPDGYVLVPTSLLWGPLSGMEVPENLLEALMQIETIKNGQWHEFVRAFQYVWKSAKVVYSPPTWVRNFLGDNFFAMLDGLNLVRDFKWVREATREFRTRGPAWRTLVRENVLDRGYNREEMGFLEDELSDPRTSVGVAFKKYAEKFIDVSRKLGRKYDYMAQVTKLASYLKKTRGLKWSEEEALEAMRGYPNYARPGDFARAASRAWWGHPFTRFTATATQAHFYYARNKPAKLLAAWMMPGLLYLFTKIVTGVTDDEIALINEDRRRRTKKLFNIVPDPFGWMDAYFQPVLPFRDDRGRLLTLDLRWIFPLANDFRVANGAGGFALPLFLGQPLTRTGIELWMNRSEYTGYDIFAQDDGTFDTSFENTKRFIRHVFHGLAPLPGLSTRGFRNIYRALTGEHDQTSVLRVTLKELFGINVSAPRVHRSDAYKLILQKFGQQDAEAFKNLLKTWNAVYRGGDVKPIHPRGVVQSYKQGLRRDALKAP